MTLLPPPVPPSVRVEHCCLSLPRADFNCSIHRPPVVWQDIAIRQLTCTGCPLRIGAAGSSFSAFMISISGSLRSPCGFQCFPSDIVQGTEYSFLPKYSLLLRADISCVPTRSWYVYFEPSSDTRSQKLDYTEMQPKSPAGPPANLCRSGCTPS